MGASQSISLNESYELRFTPSLFKLEEDDAAEQDVDITNEHTEKISTYVGSKDFKKDVEIVTDVSIRPKRENASTIQLKFKQSTAKFIESECAVVVLGKWTSSVKQRKPSVKKQPVKKSGKDSEKEKSSSHLAMMGSDDEKNESPKSEFEQDLEDISVSDIIEKIQENMHHEAYMESKLKGNLFICFKEDIELRKSGPDD
jgi:hypothetical protein